MVCLILEFNGIFLLSYFITNTLFISFSYFFSFYYLFFLFYFIVFNFIFTMVSIITKIVLTIRESFFLLLRYIDVFLFILFSLFKPHLEFYINALFYRYRQLFFTASFFHVIFKIIIKFILSFDFIFMDNIILFIILYIIAHILDLYQYIYEIIGSIGIYFFRPVTGNYGYEVYSMAGTNMFEMRKDFPPDDLDYIVNVYDRYFFGFFFFFPFFILRYFILREPLLFGVINMLFIISYLIDYNILLTYIYIIILHISRFMFYLSDESYSYKKYNEIWLDYTAFMTTFPCYPTTIRSTAYYLKNTIFKLTFYNLRLAILISNRNFIQDKEELHYGTADERKKNRDSFAMFYFDIFYRYLANRHICSTLFLNLEHSQLATHVFKHAHRFVFTNRFFWLAILIIVIYFDFYIIILFLLFIIIIIITTGLVIQQLIINLFIFFMLNVLLRNREQSNKPN